MNDLKRDIAIVCGGDSSEYDVSIRSAQGLYSFFGKERYNVCIVTIKGQDWNACFDNGDTASIDKSDFSFVKEGEVMLFDYVYITVRGTPGENGIIRGHFELLHIPYSTSGVLVEAMTLNKYVLNNYLATFGIKVAKSMLVKRGEEDKLCEQEVQDVLGMPCFVKPVADGSSFGVTKVKNTDQLTPALRRTFMESDTAMIEHFMDGTELSIDCYKTREKSVVFPATEVMGSNESFDYDAKYNGQAQEITPARISEQTTKEVAEQTSRIYDILQCNGIIRIDCIITKDEAGQDVVSMLEVNTIPGMTSTSSIPQQVRTVGLNIIDVLTEIVENQF